MTRLFCALLLLTVSACADDRAPIGTQERACQDAADNDPGIQRERFAVIANGGASATMALERKRTDLITACLRGKGVLPQGGVQRPRS